MSGFFLGGSYGRDIPVCTIFVNFLLLSSGKQVLDENSRFHDRTMYDCKEFADYIFERIKEFIPKTFFDRELVQLNERIRILRYGPGNHFAPHFDGSYTTPDCKESSRNFQDFLCLSNMFQNVPTKKVFTRVLIFSGIIQTCFPHHHFSLKTLWCFYNFSRK